MPTYDIGRVQMKYRGYYDASTAYEALDFVTYNSGIYLYVAPEPGAGITPGTEDYWLTLSVDNTTLEAEIQSLSSGQTTLAGRIDNLVAAGTLTQYYVQCQSTDADALHVVASGAGTGEILLSDVTPHLSTYTPAVGDYVRLAISTVGSELADLRVDVDGSTYASAGAAVRAIEARSLRRITVTETQAEDDYSGLLANLPAMTVTYVNSAWFDDIPDDFSGWVWVETFGESSDTVTPLNRYQVVRTLLGRERSRYFYSNSWHDWALGEALKYVSVSSQQTAEDVYGGKLENLPGMSVTFVTLSWFDDTDGITEFSGACWVWTYLTPGGTYGYQKVYSPYTSIGYDRYMNNGTWQTSWTRMGNEALKYVSAFSQETVEDVYGGLLANLPGMSVTISTLSYFSDTDGITEFSGLCWIWTYTTPSGVYGYQKVYSPYVQVGYERYMNNSTWQTSWSQIGGAGGGDSLNYVAISSAAQAEALYDKKLGNLPRMSVTFVTRTWFDDTDGITEFSGSCWVWTYATSANIYGYQRIYSPYVQTGYERYMNNGTWQSSWSPIGSEGTGIYLCFGGSSVYGQNSGSVSDRSAWPYPNAIAKACGVSCTNKAKQGQGILKAPTGGQNGYETLVANAALLPTANLITLGWGINDAAYPLGTPSDATSAETICGRWKKIIEYVQATAPNAQIIVIAPLRTKYYDWDELIPPARNWSIDQLEEAVSGICDTYNVPYISWKKCSIANNISDPANSIDGTHPTDFMYKRLAAYIAGQVSQYFLNVWAL